jgi:peptidoglycan/LPS O-acetylase OafA/YrhL
MKRPSESSSRLLELDALRGIAAFSVMIFHYAMESGPAAMKAGFRLGVTGVDLFFIISGFVILMTLEKTRHWKDFVVSRLSRLYPAYWAALSVTALFTLLWLLLEGGVVIESPLYNDNLLIQYLVNLSMLQRFVRVMDLDDVYWTLAVELVFYGFMLLVFLLGRLRQIEWIGLGMLLAGALHGTLMEGISPLVYKLVNYFLPLANHFPMFFAGILFFRMRKEKISPLRYALVGLCFLVQPLLFDDGGKSRDFVSLLDYCIMLGVYLLIFLLYTRNLLGWVVNRVTLFFGHISYVLYMLHQVVGVIVIPRLLAKYAGMSYWAVALLISMPFIIGMSWLIHRYVEKPALRSIRNWYQQREALPVA